MTRVFLFFLSEDLSGGFTYQVEKHGFNFPLELNLPKLTDPEQII